MKQSQHKPSPVMEAYRLEFQVRVLIYQEDGEFVAHALEVDLLGTGATEPQALEALREALDCQISFSVCQKQTDLLMFRAPAEYFTRWELAQTSAIRQQLMGEKADHWNCRSTVITYGKGEIEALRRNAARRKPELVSA